MLGRLHEMGSRLSIDDFGTGYSSLAYLQRLPVDEIKIDRSFVMNVATVSDDAIIVRSTIDLAHNLGLTVVAEGVEDEDGLTGDRRVRLRHGAGISPRPPGLRRGPRRVAGQIGRAATTSRR